MKFFAHLQHTYVAKNKAHQEIQDYARQVDGTLLTTDENKKKFRKGFQDVIDEINARHNRCHDISLTKRQGYENEVIVVDGNFILSIYEVEQEF